MSCSLWLTATLSYPFSLLPVLLNRQIISDNRFVKSWESSFLSNESEINHWKTSLVRTRRVTNNEWLYFPQGSGFSSFYLKEERPSFRHCLSSHFPMIQGQSPTDRRFLGQDEMACTLCMDPSSQLPATPCIPVWNLRPLVSPTYSSPGRILTSSTFYITDHNLVCAYNYLSMTLPTSIAA